MGITQIKPHKHWTFRHVYGIINVYKMALYYHHAARSGQVVTDMIAVIKYEIYCGKSEVAVLC